MSAARSHMSSGVVGAGRVVRAVAAAVAVGHARRERRGRGKVAGRRRAVRGPQGSAGGAGRLLGWGCGHRHGRPRGGRALRLRRAPLMLARRLLVLLVLRLRGFFVRALLLVRSSLRRRLGWPGRLSSPRDLVLSLGLVKRAVAGVEPSNVGILGNLCEGVRPRGQQRRQRKTTSTCPKGNQFTVTLQAHPGFFLAGCTELGRTWTR